MGANENYIDGFKSTSNSWNQEKESMIGNKGDVDYYEGVRSNFHKIMVEAVKGATTWDDVRAFINFRVSKSKMTELIKELTQKEGWDAETPLHIAARKAPSFVVCLLLHHGADAATIPDADGNLPLHSAARKNKDVRAVTTILRGNYKATETANRFGELPLHCAAQHNVKAEVITYLLYAFAGGASVADIHGNLPLHYAVKLNTPCSSIEKIKALLQAFSSAASIANNEGDVPLHCAFSNFYVNYEDDAGYEESKGHDGTLKLLRALIVADNVSAFIANDRGNLPLHCAAAISNNAEEIKYLLDAYPEAIYTKNKEGRLPLSYAAYSNINVEVTQVLLEAYPDALLVADDEDLTPLHIALSKRNGEVAKFLIKALPKSSVTMKTIGTFENVNYKGVNSDCHKIMLEAKQGKRGWDDVRMFLTHSVVFDKTQARLTRTEGLTGLTPFHIAASAGPAAPISVISALLTYAPSALSTEDKHGCLPLHYSAQYSRDTEILMAILKKYPAAAATPDEDGDLPLHCAAAHNVLVEVTQALLDAYPDAATIPNNDGLVPYQQASKNSNEAAAAFLESKKIAHEEEDTLDVETAYPGNNVVPSPNYHPGEKKEEPFQQKVAKGIFAEMGKTFAVEFVKAGFGL